VTAPGSWGIDPLDGHPEWFMRYGGPDRPFWMRLNSVQGMDQGLPFTLDPSVPTLHSRQRSWFAEKARLHRADGIFIDLAGPSSLEGADGWGNQAFGPYTSSGDAVYEAAAEAYLDDFPGANLGLLASIENGLYPDHDFLIWNVTGSNASGGTLVRPRGGSKTLEDWVKKDYVNVGDGAQMDGFAWNRDVGAFSESALLWQLRMARYFIQRKKYILLKAAAKEMPHDPDPAVDGVDDPEVVEAWTYALGCYALIADGTYAMFWSAHDLERYWNPLLTEVPLGWGIDGAKPDGDVTRPYRLPGEADNSDGRDYGVLNRSFQGGLVLVNSGTTSRLVDLPVDAGEPRYGTVAGAPVTSIDLPPKTARFLIRNGP
jgi:hypothetical protein